ncbi:MAG: prepilin-type N-terminal cleavage/methylation domain-containing protein [Methylococcaceae bacterium]|nr:prepilin-type N-terminal cleavage/methylation domain-containing protein [Methylococcaceae bacterium]
MMKIPERLRQGGFSLLEVLVAFSIMALTLGVLLRIFGVDTRLAALSGEHSRAVVLAESLLADAGMETPLQPGESNGEVDDQFQWHMTVAPFLPAGEPLPENLPFKTYWVELTVLWGDEQEPHTFTLGTLRMSGDLRQSGFPPR